MTGRPATATSVWTNARIWSVQIVNMASVTIKSPVEHAKQENVGKAIGVAMLTSVLIYVVIKPAPQTKYVKWECVHWILHLVPNAQLDTNAWRAHVFLLNAVEILNVQQEQFVREDNVN